MSVVDTYAAFMDGLKPAIRQQIAPHVSTLDQAQQMAAKADIYSTHGGKSDAGASSSGGGRGGSGGRGGGRRGKLGVVDEGPQPDSVAVIGEKKKLAELQRKSRAEAKKIKQLEKAKKKARPRTCNFCKKEGHFFRDCPDLEKLRKMSQTSGNA